MSICVHIYIGQSSRIPILVNSNNSLLKADVDNKKMDIRIYDLSGKEVEHLLIEK